ncbi:uncharacterized protein [Euwallacea similis]|uniref:uncharacterized protein n=1 Tax=Euwallacea similis TaxID=1736056 RepID=UPI00344B06CB
MAQYFEVVSQGEGNADQTHQFFNGSPETEGPQVRYILAEDVSQFQSQQLVLSTDQVMVLDGSQQVVIDQGRNYSPAQPQQFGAVVQNLNVNQSTQQIFFMEANSGQVGENVQAVIEQATQPQQVVLNHQIGPDQAGASRAVFQGSRGRQMVAHVRTPIRSTQVQVNQQPPRPMLRQNPPQQVRAPQSLPMRPMMSQQLQMRFRSTAASPQRPRQPIASPRSNVPPPLTQQPKNQQGVVNRPMLQKPQMTQVQHQIQQQSQQQAVGHVMNSPQKFVAGFQQPQRMPQQMKQEEELDDHDPTMNSSPGQMTDYKKLLEQRQQSNKLSILARLPSNIMVTNTVKQTQIEQQQQLQHPINQSTTIQQESPRPPLNQSSQIDAQVSQRKPRVPVKPRNNTGVRPQGMNSVRQQRPQKTFTTGVGPGNVGNAIRNSSPPRFGVHQSPRFSNQHEMLVQQQQQLQQQQLHHQRQIQQNSNIAPNGGVAAPASQMNYLITSPTVSRPQQQCPLPSYVPSSQIQQIIENTPVAEEYSDSIRMLVLLESGEQRLITFTLPTEACTIQEILRQVKVPFTPETNIHVTEANSNGINYIVTVGNVADLECTTEEERQPEPELQPPSQPQSQITSNPLAMHPQPLQEPPKPSTPELPKLIPGKLAVCSACGYTGEDFNKCTRCSRKLPENVKSIESSVKHEIPKRGNSPVLSKKEVVGPVLNNRPVCGNSQQEKAAPKGSTTTTVKKRVSKPKPVEESAVVISSDEEDDEKKSTKTVNEQLLNKLGASISISPITKEPSLTEIKKHVRRLTPDTSNCITISLKCRTLRIGSYRFIPADEVTLDSKCIVIKAPAVDSKSDIKTVRIDRGDIIKVLVCYNKALPVIFCYLNLGGAPVICDMLNLTRESGLYFDPVDEKEASYRKITLLPDDNIEDLKSMFVDLYGGPPAIDELTVKEANDILIKACPKTGPTARLGSFSEIKEILMYPKEGQGRLSINTEDYVCLAVDQFLNDKIIDFYLKYLWENLAPELQEKVHIFSTFFYKRLTTKATKAARKSHPYESDSNLTAAEKRHCRVRNWTKRIKLFDKDFIVVPINENAHWFLAIICFPGLLVPQTFDGKSYNPEPKPKKTKANDNAVKQVEVKKEAPIQCEELVLSDKDEADSDSDMCSDCSDDTVPAGLAPPIKTKQMSRPPIKQPCILIFDSLAGPSRSRVVATLRDYLTVEHKVKMDSERVFDKDTIKGACCKVPQQNNFTDCGLYVLQYVEQFFKDPITDYNIPIKGIVDWFEEITVTKKREDICNLLKRLMTEAGTDIKCLPDIALPTLDGKLIERQEPEREEQENCEDDMFTDIEDSEMADVTGATINTSRSDDDDLSTPETEDNTQHFSIKLSNNGLSDASNESTSQSMKPSLSEVPRQTSNKDTLSYLKAKRIVRHKPTEEPGPKKSKVED